MFEQLEARALLTAVSWDGGGGDLNWNSPENWIDNVLPGSSDDVAIDVPVDITVSLVGSTTIESLQNAENLVVNGDLLVQGLSYNEGVVEVQSGELILRGGGTSTGSYFGAPGKTLGLWGSHTLTGSSSIFGERQREGIGRELRY